MRDSVRSGPRPGFTLLEIMIVLVMIGILGGLAIPRLNTGRFKVDAAMHVAQAALQQAERSAIQRQTNVIASFDIANNRIRIHNDVNNNGTIDAGETTRWMTLEDGVRFATPPKGLTSGSVASPVTGNNIKTSADGFPMITYRRDGAASSSAEIYMRSSSTDTNDFRVLTVTQSTGRVDLYRYGIGVWRKAR